MSYASDQILRISKRFSDGYYQRMNLMSRGIPTPEPFNVDVILIDDLRQNEYIPTLTTKQRDNILNQLL